MREAFSLDWSDQCTADYARAFLQDDPRRLCKAVASSPLVGIRTFYWTMRLTVLCLFNCFYTPLDPPDGISARETPGIFGYVRAFFGVVESQFRKGFTYALPCAGVRFLSPRGSFSVRFGRRRASAPVLLCGEYIFPKHRSVCQILLSGQTHGSLAT